MTDTAEWDFVRSRTFTSVCEWLKTSIDPIDSITSIASASSLTSIPLEELPYIPRPASRLSILKQNYHAYSNPHNGDIMPSPRKRTRTQDDQLSIATTTSGFRNIQLFPTTNSQPSKVRSNSPVRELRVIYRSATPPLKYTTSADEHTPQSVLDLIHGLPLHGIGVIPGSLKVQYSSFRDHIAIGGDRRV
jgi:hypothetical protein